MKYINICSVARVSTVNCITWDMGSYHLIVGSRLSDPSPIKEYQWLVIRAGAMHAVARQMYFWRKGGVEWYH